MNFKYYPNNRKLYNQDTGSYATLQDVYLCMKLRIPVRVIKGPGSIDITVPIALKALSKYGTSDFQDINKLRASLFENKIS